MRYESNESELRELDLAVVHYMKVWAHLEVALSALLYEILHMEPRSSHIPYVIYYTPPGFDSRLKIVDKVLRRFIQENPTIITIEPYWKKIQGWLKQAKDIRNQVAHGAPLIIGRDGQNYVRHAPPAFDITRMGNLKGPISGLSVDALRQGTRSVLNLVECIDFTNKIITAFHQGGPETLQNTVPPLEAYLQTLPNYRPGDQTARESEGQPESSVE